MKNIDYKWRALALLWVAFFLQQGTRQLFGPSVPAICREPTRSQVAAEDASANAQAKTVMHFFITDVSFLPLQAVFVLRSSTAAATFAKSFASLALGTVEKASRTRPESTIVPVEYFSIRWRRTSSASTPTGFTHMK